MRLSTRCQSVHPSVTHVSVRPVCHQSVVRPSVTQVSVCPSICHSGRRPSVCHSGVRPSVCHPCERPSVRLSLRSLPSVCHPYVLPSIRLSPRCPSIRLSPRCKGPTSHIATQGNLLITVTIDLSQCLLIYARNCVLWIPALRARRNLLHHFVLKVGNKYRLLILGTRSMEYARKIILRK